MEWARRRGTLARCAISGAPARTRGVRNARERFFAEAFGDLLDVLMMARLQRRAELLREEIADQRNAPMPQGDTLVEQGKRGVRVALLTGAFGETRDGESGGGHVDGKRGRPCTE